MSLDSDAWRAFFVLYAVGLIGGFAVMPYTATLIRPKLEGRRLTVRTALALQFLQTAVFLGLAILLGLRAALATGLASDVTRRTMASPREYLVALLLGAGAAIIVCVVDALVFLPHVPSLREASRPLLALPLWQRMLAAIYGGFTEELIMRLGIFSLLAWAARAVSGALTPSVLWIVNVLVALLFGAAHLPAAAALVGLTSGMIGRTLFINGVVSLTFGYVFIRYGLGAAILSHLAADVILQLAGELGARQK
jgi:hypothetical protein